MDIEAPLVAKKAKAGQFIILRVDEDGERIPLTIADYDREKGTVTIIFQIVGATTEKLNHAQRGRFACTDFVGPLGMADRDRRAEEGLPSSAAAWAAPSRYPVAQEAPRAAARTVTLDRRLPQQGPRDPGGRVQRLLRPRHA